MDSKNGSPGAEPDSSSSTTHNMDDVDSAGRVSRRGFFRFTAASGLAAYAGGREAAAKPGSASGSSVIVIGAGFAGLAAARRLIERGFAVTIIEAQDRPGGRAKTLHGFVDHPVELGCKWVNRRDPYISDYIGTFKLKTIGDKWAGLLTNDVRGDGRYQPLERRDDLALWKSFNKVNREMALLREGSTETIGDIGDRLELTRLQRILLDAEIASDAGVLPTGVGGYEWWYEDDGIGPNKIFRDGMSGLVERLASGLDVRLGHVVTGIDYSADGATVHLLDRESLAARYVVVTVPLGVLKLARGQRGYIEFNPPLSTAKRDAIAAIPVGTFNKVMMRFTDRFWAKVKNPYGSGKWTFLYLLEDHFAGPTLFCDASYGRKSKELRGGAVLHGLVSGEWGRSVELNDELVALMVSRLKGVFGDDTVRDHIPDGRALPPYHVMSWDDEPFARGCYSVAAVGTLPHRRNLGAPELGTLYFAGEAIGSKVPGDGFRTATVVAALGSGVDAANQIIG